MIPEGWSEARLGEVATLTPGINKPLSAMGRGTLYLTVQELYVGSEINPDLLGRIAVTTDEISRFCLHPGDIIFGKSSVKREGIGYPNRFSGATEPVVASGFTFVARPKGGIVDSRYLLHSLRQQSSRTWLINNS
jgi:type I restriction enzyme S subunit